MFKFIGAALGYFLFRGFFGGVLGFIAGSAIDNYLASGSSKSEGNSEFEYYRRHSAGPRNDFATMLMVLSAAVMKADGKILKVELDFVKNFFSQQFGPRFNREHLQVLKHFLDGAEIPLSQICNDIRSRTQVEVRIQLLYYLFGLAGADGKIEASEIGVIKNMAALMDIPDRDFESVKNMFFRDVNSDYKVLEIEPNASDDDIKKAYRQMAVRYHPDKVAHMGEEYQKGAKEKFQKIQEAYENIKKQRGIN
ncbi:MAG: DnaJ domain-containing protein [Bacteroidia bacterium]|nr:DnaJ domain-containing protein [Bacteroidia bacterium]